MTALPAVLQLESPAIRTVSDFIHQHPELGYQEFQASALLKKFLADRGFSIRENYGGVETAFLASDASDGADENIPLFAFLGEYDALSGLGHACGHNLIACVALSAVLAAREQLRQEKLPFRIAFIGTPAEETLGGKVKMIEGGAFREVSSALEAHPFHKTIPDPGCLSVSRCRIIFHGKASHAAIAPEKGINALDAICEFCCDIRAWRARLSERERVHGIITKGGDAPNIIPDYTEAFYYVRAPNEKTVVPLKLHLEELAAKAAASTGCKQEVIWVSSYQGMIFNEPLNTEFIQVWKRLYGEDLPVTNGTEGRGSTDAGNVSYVIPCAHFYFGITNGEFRALHTEEFREAAGSDFAFQQTLRTGAAMAEICSRYFRDLAFRLAIRAAWQKALTAE